MNQDFLAIHPADNVWVALKNLRKGHHIPCETGDIELQANIFAKHKFTITALEPGDEVIMYGIVVGKAQEALPPGSVITTSNVVHKTTPVESRTPVTSWNAPDVSRWQDATFMGYPRKDGSVGTANYWLVFPLVFCENKVVDVLRDALTDALGHSRYHRYRVYARRWLTNVVGVPATPGLWDDDVQGDVVASPFPNVDGVKFLSHQMGCGGTRQDARALCGLLAGYLTNPNVGGATVLSLGCQNAQYDMLKEELARRNPKFDKPIGFLDRQIVGSEKHLIEASLEVTLEGMQRINNIKRQPTPLSKLVIGLECGGSDGFSGISANPLVGEISDMVVALGGSAILSEFPELCGVEQELVNRCVSDETADRFLDLMERYEKAAEASGSGFDMNPSPGNIRDGLITDAMKSAGAAKKGGISPITDVLDYPEKVVQPGLNLLCTPGNDVESTTALAAAGANLILFTTGLGTPTGNPIVPVVKISSNTHILKRMHDIIDYDAGRIISGEETIQSAAEQLMQQLVEIASGTQKAKADINEQNDFIPWKRGVSL